MYVRPLERVDEAASRWKSRWTSQGSETTSAIFEGTLRCYGPEKPLFDKTWKLSDIERM